MRGWPLLMLAAGGLASLAQPPAAMARVRETGRVVSVPLPPSRPEPPKPPEGAPRPERAPDTAPALSACLARFTESGGVALPAATKGAGGECTIEEAVTFRRITMPDGGTVELESAITVGCAFGLAMLEWIRSDLPGILPPGTGRLVRLTSVGGEACRPRNGTAGAFISEHATGNALDIGGLVLQDGRTIRLTQPDGATRALREAIQQSACRRFTTVLGPGSDDAHKDHVHLDLRKRNRDYRICQWIVE